MGNTMGTMGNTTPLYCCFWDIHLPMECGCENFSRNTWSSAQDPDSGRVGGAEVAGRQEQGPVNGGAMTFQTDPAGEIEIRLWSFELTRSDHIMSCSLSKKWGLSWILIKNEGLSMIIIKNEGLSWILIYLAFKIANTHQIHRPKSRIGSWRAERRDAKRLAKRGSGEDSTIVSIALVVYTIPIGSMYAIYGNIYHQYTPNVSTYTIHGSYGICIYMSLMMMYIMWELGIIVIPSISSLVVYANVFPLYFYVKIMGEWGERILEGMLVFKCWENHQKSWLPWS